MSQFNEFIVEDAALAWFEELGYVIGHESHLAPGELRVRVKAGEPCIAEAIQ